MWPSTSKSPLASMLLANVAIPTTLSVSAMLVMSNSVLPSTSRLPLASMSPDTVSDVSVPKFVNEELTTLDPKVVALNISV